MSEPQNGEYTYWKRPWNQWVVLAAGFLQLASLRMNIQEYQDIYDAGIFSASEWEIYAAEQIWRCILNGTLAACLLGIFVTGRFAKNRKAAKLMEGLLLLIMATLLAGMGMRLQLYLSGGKCIVWLLLVLIALGGAIYDLLQFRKAQRG